MPVEFWPVVRIEDPCGPIFYLGSMQPTDIKQVTFVPVVSATVPSVEPSATSLAASSTVRLYEKPGGYQRAGDPKRMELIKHFVASRATCLVPPVVLSTRGAWQFVPDSSG